MAISAQIPNAELRSIARQIADRAPAQVTAAFAGATPTRLAENFPVWLLAPDAVARTRDIAEAATRTGDWHHQVRAADGAVRFARSTVRDGRWIVGEVARSGLEADIDATVSWIDDHIPQDLDARLLIAPAYYLTAFWLHGPEEDRIVLVQAPAALRNLETNVDYTAAEFLARLADNPSSAGVPPLPDQI
jgi:hypothetical protein